jgi:formylglycine-generating enzyme required for sulfatase activity
VGVRKYADLNLRLERGRGRRFQGWMRFPDGADFRIDLPAPFTSEELRQQCENVEAQIGSGGSSKVPGQAGERLFQAVFSPDARQCFRSLLDRLSEDQGVRLRLALDGEAALWPWEYLSDDGHFFGVDEAVTILRVPDVPKRVPALRVEPPLRLLAVMVSPPGYDVLEVEKEWERLQAALAPLVKEGKIKLERLESPTLAALDARLRRPCEILHYTGHGRFDADHSDGAILLLDGGGQRRWIPGKQFAGLLRRRKAPRLVVLNTCEGARTGEGAPFSGFAPSLIRHGVPAVVAMRFSISDEAAILWSECFYEEIARGVPVDAAVNEARRTLYTHLFEAEWGTPVLYLRAEDGRLFDLPGSPPPPPLSLLQRWRDWLLVHRVQLTLGALLLMLASGIALHQAGYLFPKESWIVVPNARPLSTAQNPPECPPPRGIDMKLRIIPSGAFLMGSPHASDEQPVRRFEIPTFCLGVYEVTQAQWTEVLKSNPSRAQKDFLPVARVTFAEANDFVNELNRREGKKVFRLPTEAEWEYAARAGKSFGEEPPPGPETANCHSDGVARIGSFSPNPWGLYDMNGNVWEWVSDWYGPYEKDEDPKGPKGGKKRVRRGGSHDVAFETCRSAKRSAVDPDRRNRDTGLRIVREIASPSPGDASKPETTPHRPQL